MLFTFKQHLAVIIRLFGLRLVDVRHSLHFTSHYFGMSQSSRLIEKWSFSAEVVIPRV